MKLLPLLILTGAAVQLSLPAEAQSIGPSVINASGGSNTSAGITQEWSIGELSATSTFSGVNLVVTPGVLQPIMQGVSVKETIAANANMRVFPNPASTVLFISCMPTESAELNVSLTDAMGRVLQKETYETERGVAFQKSLPMASYAAGLYLVTINRTGKGAPITESFTVRKIN